MRISVPALLMLLVIAFGVVNYVVVNLSADRIVELLSNPPRSGRETAATPPDARVLAQVHDEVSLLVVRLLTILLVFTLLSLAGGLGLASSILRPLRQVTDAVASIARGDFSQTVRFRAGFEIDELGRSFNTMADFISAMIEQRDTYMSEAFRVGSLVLDDHGRVTSVNPMAGEILGISRSDLVGHRVEDILEDKPHLAPTFMSFCRDRLRQDASTLPVEVNLSADRPGDKRLSVAFSYLRNERNVPIAMIFHFRDLSNIETLFELFTHTDRLASLGTFTMGLSHELRNPLGALKGTAQLLSEKNRDREECRPYLDRIVQEVNRLDRLVQELHDFSRSSIVEREPCDLNSLASSALQETLRGIAEERKATRTVVEDYAPQLPSVLAQPDRVKRAIGNVLINAFDFMPEGATLRLSTRQVQSEQGRRHAILDIENTGSQIPAESLQKIFEPFFSTRKGGTGLGLAIAYQIVLQNQARMQAFSGDDQVRFEFVFRDLARDRQDERGR